VRTLTADPTNRVPHLAFQPNALSTHPALAMEAVETAYYLRLLAQDLPGVLADVTRILASHEISIEAILQKPPAENARLVPVIILTHRIRERQMVNAIRAIESLDTIQGAVTRIRLEHLDYA